MRLVRIDRLAPGGAALQPHQRWTVVSGASPELRRRLFQTVRALVGDEPPECSGVLEVGGVRLALDRGTLDQLQLDRRLDPVLSFRAGSERTATVPAAAAPDAPADPSGPDAPASSWVTSTVVAGRTRDELRAELRSVTSARTRLGERMEEARRHLDSFSRAALEVCRGQIDALEARRSSLRAEWRAAQDERSARRDELLGQLAAARAALEAVGPVDAAPVRRTRDELAQLIDVPEQPVQEAAELADRLEATLAVVVASQQRRAEEEARLEAASRELAEARAELTEAERAARSPDFDPEVVRRLEEVRDEIFSTDDRGLLGSGRKRRIQELRAEEAVLLDRLGFDTYSAYVMGIPSTRTDLERSERLVAARERVVAAEAALGEVRAASPVDAAPEGMRELFTLLARAEELTGVRQHPGAEDEPVEALPSEVEQVIARLRGMRTGPPGMEAPEVRAAVEALAALTGTGPFETPREALAAADRWIEEASARAEQRDELVDRVHELEARLADLDAVSEPEIDLTELAHVEEELDAALDRLAAAEDRVRAHEAAMEQLAELRTEELELRERERELLAALSDAGEPSPEPAAPPAGEQPAATPPPYRGPVAPAERTEHAGDPHWRLVARLAEQRAVSFVGSVPLVVDGLPEDDRDRDRLVERIEAMSDLVQILVLSDDPEVARRAERAGSDAAVVRYG